MKAQDKFAASVVLAAILLGIVSIAGYVTNAMWVFKHLSAGITLETLVSLAGIVLVPLGTLHGIYTWF